MPDPDLEIRGGQSSRPLDKGGGASQKTIFSALRASVWSNNKGGWGGQGPFPGYTTGLAARVSLGLKKSPGYTHHIPIENKTSQAIVRRARFARFYNYFFIARLQYSLGAETDYDALTSVIAGKMGLYGAGTGIDSSYVLSGPDVSLQNVMKKTAISNGKRT